MGSYTIDLVDDSGYQDASRKMSSSVRHLRAIFSEMLSHCHCRWAG
jgi:hypothetical protein